MKADEKMWGKKDYFGKNKSWKEIWVKILPKRKNETRIFKRSVKGGNDFDRNKKERTRKIQMKKKITKQE